MTHMQLYFSSGNNEDAGLNWFDKSNTVKPSDHGRKQSVQTVGAAAATGSTGFRKTADKFLTCCPAQKQPFKRKKPVRAVINNP